MICNTNQDIFKYWGYYKHVIKNERVKQMNKKAATATRTIGAIMAVGGAAAMIGSAMGGNKSSKKQIKKTADKAVKTITGIMDSIQSMM